MLRLSQTEMLKALGLDGVLDYKRLPSTSWERMSRHFACCLRTGGWQEFPWKRLADDELQLPN